MGIVAEKWKIAAVLALVRRTPLEMVNIPGFLHHDSKTYLFLVRIGFDVADVKRTLDSLGMREYSQGPLRDDKGRERDLWVFGTYVQKLQTYIKFAVYVKDGTVGCICVSFHEAERSMFFPYASEGEEA